MRLPPHHPRTALGIDRRELLVLGSSAVIAPLLDAGPLARMAAALTDAARPLSVGYLEDSDRLERLDLLPWGTGAPGGWGTVPAAALPIGDLDLIGESVFVRVHGLFPALPIGEKENTDSAVLAVRFRQQDDPLAPEMQEFFAWHVRRHPFGQGQGVVARTPLGLSGELEVAVEHYPRGTGARVLQGRGSYRVDEGLAGQRYTTTFTADPIDGLPKIQRGIYFLGINTAIWDRSVKLPGSRRLREMAAQLRSVVISIEAAPREV